MKLSRYVFDVTTLDLSLPPEPWRQAVPKAVGGGIMWSAAGLPSSYVVRWERALIIPNRLTEAEWPTYRAMLEWGMQGGVITWTPDLVGAPATSYSLYLLAPAITDGGEVPRLTFPGDQSHTIIVRRTDSAALDVEFFG